MSFCSYYDTQQCHSCSWIDYHYAEQLKLKGEHLHTLLNPYKPEDWLKPATSPLKGFRNKAKMVATPTLEGIVLGLSEEVSLIECPLYDISMQKTLHTIQEWLRELGIKGYDVRLRKGELKYVLLTKSKSNGSMMLRFVLKSHGIIGRLENGVDDLIKRAPDLKVITVNIQPVHMAILEGDEEIFLTEQRRLEERFNGIPLYIRPKSFFQTNPEVAEKLYRTASEWADESKPKILWDLFCGVGGFGLHCATGDRSIVGIEIEPEAIECARDSAAQLELKNVRFESLDAASFGASSGEKPDVIIVNPPRRGLGEQLCKWLIRVNADRILYSSCNATSLAKDLESLSGYSVRRVQLFDMFPHTTHYEVLVELVLV
ncbi:MAG: 23S rRNA (uracil(747)-C(5))-methyltransferase RlmC [Sulfuricurvum sp.]|uniref:23S rRNA (uracil(747)-C(5))-methyltransferase RlmC n=1 Tax=Sulfuricurvum sp. TaxID=2025608 RepID=UPI002733CEA0|nr:23S rRNA (uracil(747)-C(5))-methyltransferase RlmC [Sulfuricurvum sp.]MDP2849591.1 23S rRNA (uracil(747)-C(5))-methyltransferase RlmC [Sulfuricurvum sp.]